MMRTPDATPEHDGSTRFEHPVWISKRVADLLFGVALVALVAYAAVLGRDLSFFSDDWPIIAEHHSGDYLRPYGGHLLLVPIAIFRFFWETAGLSTYTPYRAVGLVAFAVLAVAFYLYLRSRAQAAVAVVGALAVVWYSQGHFNILFPVTINFAIPMAATVAIWMLFDRQRERYDVRLDVVAALLVGISLLNGGPGLVAVVAVGTELLLRRAPWRRWLLLVVPFAFWGVWYLEHRERIEHPNSVFGTIRFAMHQLQEAFAGFAGGWDPGGYVLLVGAAAVFALALFRWHTFTPRAAAALTAAGAFGVLTGYSARHESLPPVPADTPRYLWLVSFLLVAALVEVVRPLRLSPVVPIAGAVLVAISAVALVDNMRDYGAEVLRYVRTTRTYMVAVEAMPDRVDRARIMPLSLHIVRAGAYIDAVRDLGTAVDGVGLDDLGSEHDRREADHWMIEDLGIAVSEGTSCDVLTASNQREVATRAAAAVYVRAGDVGASVSIRRLARRFHAPIKQLDPGEEAFLALPRDRSRFPWHVRVDGVGASIARCA